MKSDNLVHVLEKSNQGVVAMRRLNNEAHAETERGEGRRRVASYDLRYRGPESSQLIAVPYTRSHIWMCT
jgi:hypothetical protein